LILKRGPSAFPSGSKRGMESFQGAVPPAVNKAAASLLRAREKPSAVSIGRKKNTLEQKEKEASRRLGRAAAPTETLHIRYAYSREKKKRIGVLPVEKKSRVDSRVSSSGKKGTGLRAFAEGTMG